MPDSTLTLASFRVPVYSLALVVGIVLSLGISLRQTTIRSGTLLDACLGALVGAVIGGRAEHVLVNWSYFASNLSEALRPSAGGLDWHGALLGGLLGLALVARWRRLPLRDLLDAAAPALPLLAFSAWLGCWAAVCGYGREVDTLAHYPAFSVAETRDVYGIVAPRYNTQVFGMALSLALLLLSVVLMRRGWLKHRRYWLLLTLLSAGMFIIGFFRGDASPVAAGLRAEQVIDMILCGISLFLTFASGRKDVRSP